MTTDLIARLDKWLVANRPDYYAKLQPPTTPANLDAFEKQFQLKLPSDFRAFYQWRNGQDPNSSASLIENWMFSTLEDITSSKDLFDGMIGSDFEDPKWWRRSWVPFLNNGGGDHLCLDLAAEDFGTPGQLLVFYHDWDKREPEYPNLEAWLKQFVDSAESGKLKLS